MLADGEFDKQVGNDGVDVWVTQMGDYMNMNTAFVDKKNGIVAIVDPFDFVSGFLRQIGYTARIGRRLRESSGDWRRTLDQHECIRIHRLGCRSLPGPSSFGENI